MALLHKLEKNYHSQDTEASKHKLDIRMSKSYNRYDDCLNTEANMTMPVVVSDITDILACQKKSVCGKGCIRM